MSEYADFGGYYRARVDRSWSTNSVGIWLINRRIIDGAPTTTVAQPAELTWEEHDEQAILPSRPSLWLPAELGRAVLDELAGHYGGTGEVRTLRRDYEAERARVDNLIGHLIGVPR